MSTFAHRLTPRDNCGIGSSQSARPAGVGAGSDWFGQFASSITDLFSCAEPRRLAKQMSPRSFVPPPEPKDEVMFLSDESLSESASTRASSKPSKEEAEALKKQLKQKEDDDAHAFYEQLSIFKQKRAAAPKDTVPREFSNLEAIAQRWSKLADEGGRHYEPHLMDKLVYLDKVDHLSYGDRYGAFVHASNASSFDDNFKAHLSGFGVTSESRFQDPAYVRARAESRPSSKERPSVRSK